MTKKIEEEERKDEEEGEMIDEGEKKVTVVRVGYMIVKKSGFNLNFVFESICVMIIDYFYIKETSII